MSQINLNSISGITSITTPAGVDNQLTVHTNDTTERFKIDSVGNLHSNGKLTINPDDGTTTWKRENKNMHQIRDDVYIEGTVNVGDKAGFDATPLGITSFTWVSAGTSYYSLTTNAHAIPQGTNVLIKDSVSGFQEAYNTTSGAGTTITVERALDPSSQLSVANTKVVVYTPADPRGCLNVAKNYAKVLENGFNPILRGFVGSSTTHPVGINTEVFKIEIKRDGIEEDSVATLLHSTRQMGSKQRLALTIDDGKSYPQGKNLVLTQTGVKINADDSAFSDANALLEVDGNVAIGITTPGKLGIGTHNPLTLLHLKSDDPTLRIQRNNQSAYGDITVDTAGKMFLKSDPNNAANGDGFSFTVNNSKKLSIDSNGLGITTTTTAARNAGVGTEIGTIIFNITDNKLELYANDLRWRGFSPADPNISSISGTLYAGAASTLTLAGGNFLQSSLQVRFVQNTRSVDVTVTVTPSSDSAATVTVPATVYNNIQGSDVVSITVTNSDGVVSNTVTKTAVGLPSGGNITTSGSYRIHTFTSTGNFIVPTGTTLTNVEYLVVGGGGGGGPSNQGHQGGGGGAGGLRTSVVGATSGRGSSAEARVTYTAGTYGVSVGAGGGSRSQGGGYGFNGTQSYLTLTGGGYITSTGGGGGGMGQNNGASRGGLNGGCGGGAASSDQSIAAPGSGTAGQGYDGGQPTCVGCGQGGAGGGAGGSGSVGGSGGVGQNNTPGGAGLVNNITGSNVTYATGGDCPGAAGGNQNPGAANTGNGGDGGYSNNNSPTGQAGGSGIVIVRYVL